MTTSRKWYEAVVDWLIELDSNSVMPSQITEVTKLKAAVNHAKLFVPKELHNKKQDIVELEKRLKVATEEARAARRGKKTTFPETPNTVLQVKKDSRNSMLRYPSQIMDDVTDYMFFGFYDYIPPFSAASGNRARLGVKADGSPSAFENGQLQQKTVQSNLNLGQYNNSVTKNAKRAEGFRQVVLYMPDDVQDAFSASWEGKQFGTLAADMLTTAGAQNSVDAIRKATNTVSGAADRLRVNATAKLVTKLASGITGDQITEGDVFSGVKGVVRNPNVEVLFEKMSLRTFDHTFRMSAYDQQDEEHIRQIITQFKKAMLPSYGVGNVFNESEQRDGLDGAFIKIPKLVQVAYMRGGAINPFLPQYKLCALTDVNVNYTPDNNYATFGNNGGPVSYELKLNFMETKLVFAEDIEAFEVNTLGDYKKYFPDGFQGRIDELY